MRAIRRRRFLKLAGWGAAGFAGLSGCQAQTDGLTARGFDGGTPKVDAEAPDLGSEPDMVWLDAAQVDAAQVDASSLDAGQIADAGASVFIIAEAFSVVLNDPSCSRHSHGIRVRAGSYEDDTPVSYLGGSHEVLFRPSELVQLAAGARLPFATIGDGSSHGHCGTAWATFVGPEDQTLIDICETLGTAACIH